MSQQMLPSILWACIAEVQANAPEGNHAFFSCVTMDWDASDDLKAFTLVKIFTEGYEFWSQGWQLKFNEADILHAHSSLYMAAAS